MRRGGAFGIQRRILLALLAPLAFSLIVSVASVLYLVNRLLIQQVQAKVETDLRSGTEIYRGRLERLGDFVGFASRLRSLRTAMEQGDVDTLRIELQALRARHGDDVLAVADSKGRVVVRARNPFSSGDDVSHLGPVRRALVGEDSASTEALTNADLKAEDDELASQAEIQVLPTPMSSPGKPQVLTSGLALFAASPIHNSQGRVIGVLYAADLLNRDYTIVDRIRSTVFGDESYGGRPVGTATLFLGEVRVATNVLGAQGQRAVGTRLSAQVAERVLRQKTRWIGRAFVVTDWYLTAYEPLCNYRGEVVGSLYVGVLERRYRDLLWRTLGAVGGIHMVGTALVLGLATALARALSRPIQGLAEGARRVASGDLSHEISLTSRDEIGDLAAEFNTMTASLRDRDAAIEQLNKDLEEKVRQRNSELEQRNLELLKARGELLDVMEKQRHTNQELHASLERLQATQEELARSAKLAALGALAEGVAQEISAPLAGIQATLQTLRSGDSHDKADQEGLQVIANHAQRMRKIASGLLTFARREVSHAEAVDIEALVRESLERVAPQALEARVAIETTFAGGLPSVLGDPSRLSQVLTNLAINGLHASPKGGKLSIQTGVSEDGAYVFASFTDGGPSMRTGDRDRASNPFPAAMASEQGMTPSISQAIVEEHGGRITLDTDSGRGNTYTVILPRRPQS